MAFAGLRWELADRLATAMGELVAGLRSARQSPGASTTEPMPAPSTLGLRQGRGGSAASVAARRVVVVPPVWHWRWVEVVLPRAVPVERLTVLEAVGGRPPCDGPGAEECGVEPARDGLGAQVGLRLGQLGHESGEVVAGGNDGCTLGEGPPAALADLRGKASHRVLGEAPVDAGAATGALHDAGWSRSGDPSPSGIAGRGQLGDEFRTFSRSRRRRALSCPTERRDSSSWRGSSLRASSPSGRRTGSAP